MKKNKNLKEQADQNKTPDSTKKTENQDNFAFLENLQTNPQYKCKFLEGGRKYRTKEGKESIRVVKQKDTKFYNSGDTIYAYADFTYDRYSLKDKKLIRGEKWACSAYQSQGSQYSGDEKNLSQDQIDYVTNYLTQNSDKGYLRFKSLSKLTSEEQLQVDQNIVQPVDLNKLNARLFPEPNKYFIYKKSGMLQTGPGADAMEKIIREKESAGWTKVTPRSDELYLYENPYNTPDNSIDMSMLYPDYFKTTFKMWIPKSKAQSVNWKEEGQANKKAFKETSVDRKGCKLAIGALYTDKFEKRGMFSDQDILLKKEYVKKCMAQKEFRKGIDKKVDALAALPKTDKYSLAESKKDNLKSMIHETLVNVKNKKETSVLEKRIIKNRLDFVIESYNKDNDKDKFFKSIVYEFNYIHEQGYDDSLLTEGLGDGLLSWFLGRAGGGGVDTFVERMVAALAKGLGIDPNSKWTQLIAIALGNVEMSDLPKLFRLDCGYISGLISKSVIELGLKKLGQKAGMNDMFSDILRNTMDSMFRSEGFEKSFQEAFSHHLCPLLAKFTSNMSKVDQSLTSKVMTT